MKLAAALILIAAPAAAQYPYDAGSQFNRQQQQWLLQQQQTRDAWDAQQERNRELQWEADRALKRAAGD